MIAILRRKSTWRLFLALLLGFLLGKSLDTRERSSPQYDHEEYRAVIEKIYLSKDQNIEQGRFRSDGSLQNVDKPMDRSIMKVEQKDWAKRKDIPHLAFVVCGGRVDEAFVMLKSAILFTKSPLAIHIITDAAELDEEISMLIEDLPPTVRARLNYKLYEAAFPTSKSCTDCMNEHLDWKTFFRPCSAQRLFLADVLTDVDSVLYVDIDVLFLAPIEQIWSHLFKFNSTQFIAAVSVTEEPKGGNYNKRMNVPFYGPSGVNAGVLLMNLTRLRASSWLELMGEYYLKYKEQAKFYDQDLINIYMSRHPDQAGLLPCQWNYRYFHCKHGARCREADTNGAALIHGLTFSFLNNRNPAFRATYSAFNKFDLNKHTIQHDLVARMRSNLRRLPKIGCARYPQVFTKRMENLD